MHPRLVSRRLAPALMKAMFAPERAVAEGRLAHTLIELVTTRAPGARR